MSLCLLHPFCSVCTTEALFGKEEKRFALLAEVSRMGCLRVALKFGDPIPLCGDVKKVSPSRRRTGALCTSSEQHFRARCRT